MKAARFYDRGDIRIEDIPEPKVLPGTVGIQVAWCGICGTDLHEFMEGPIFIPPCWSSTSNFGRICTCNNGT